MVGPEANRFALHTPNRAHPDYLGSIRQEIAAARSDTNTPITYEMVRGLLLLTNAIKEASRLESPVSMLPRGLLREVEFGGYRLPVGARGYLAVSATHRLSEVFANPHTFDPDRFSAPRDEERRIPYSLLTFGGGQRICIDVNFAQIEVKALALEVFQRFELQPLGSERPRQPSFITAGIPGGIHVRALPR
ncbi:MAG: cytochrome P450 [Chloroflexi bacterium]|nr:cytochrome P450 [Chloroflexota bacterium]